MKNHIRLSILTCAMLFWSFSSLFAGHIVGGEIYYDYLGNSQYAITLVVYRDCESTTAFDDQAALGIFETANGNLHDVVNINYNSSTMEELPPILENPCNLIPTQLCIERAIYTTTVTLPDIAGGYTLAYQRCCRANGIDNLAFNQQGMTLSTAIPDVDDIGGHNSSARFTDLPPITLCRNSAFFFDHGAVDPDGDQLVYSFCDPLSGATPDQPAPNTPDNPPYNPISWANGFSASYPVTSTTSPFSIDPTTGYITGTATQLGTFIISICVSEYRNGVLVNTISRDFQYRVVTCESVSAEFPTLSNSSYQSCSGLSVNFDNTSVASSNTIYHWDFGITGTDADTSNAYEPSYSFPGPGTYQIVLTTNPGWPCEDQAVHDYTVFPPVVPTITPTTTNTYACINMQDTYDFEVTGSYSTAANVLWNFGTGATPLTSVSNSPPNVALPANAAQWVVTVQVSENGCVGTDTQTITNQPDPIASIAPQNVFCQGLEYSFTANSLNAATQTWDFGGNGVADLSNINSPSFVYSQSGTYTVELVATANQACNDTASADFEVSLLPETFFERPDAQCLENNSFSFVAEGALTLNPQYSWTFGASASVSSSYSSQPSGISFDSAEVHPVSLTITENNCSVSYTDSVAVTQHILPDFGVEATSGCPGHVAQVTAVTESIVPVYYLWDFGNGESSSQGTTNHAYDLPGVYAITVTAFTNQGCYDSLTLTFPNAVTIYPNPDPSFTIEPQVMDIANAVCQIVGLYQEGNCTYFMSDGGQADGCDVEYNWQESGVQTIIHYVTSPQGCTSSTTGEVVISGHTFYAPTGFTPNDDGINDYWIPVMTGMTSFKLEVFNRWGDLIYTTTDVNRPWAGQVKEGTYYVPNGVYNYRVTMKDLVFQAHEFTGSILLNR